MTVAYGIFSGGLDGMLAASLLKNQGLEVRLITFVTPFFGADRALRSAKAIGLETRPVELTEPLLAVLRAPRHGFGRYMNPCVDCHALMFRRAGEIMDLEGGDFLFSGEVLGQRPMSQNRRALDIVAHESGRAEVILRPLSALALPPTAMEERGWVIREALKGFSGRTRRPQMALARELGVTDYPSPAGGCLLTDPVFSRRLKELSAMEGLADVRNMELLKWGRHFRLPGGVKVIVGRNQAENNALEDLTRPEDLVLQAEGVPGPLVLLPGGGRLEVGDPSVRLAAAMTVSYGDAPDGVPTPVRVTGPGGDHRMEASGRPKADFADWMV